MDNACSVERIGDTLDPVGMATAELLQRFQNIAPVIGEFFSQQSAVAGVLTCRSGRSLIFRGDLAANHRRIGTFVAGDVLGGELQLSKKAA